MWFSSCMRGEKRFPMFWIHYCFLNFPFDLLNHFVPPLDQRFKSACTLSWKSSIPHIFCWWRRAATRRLVWWGCFPVYWYICHVYLVLLTLSGACRSHVFFLWILLCWPIVGRNYNLAKWPEYFKVFLSGRKICHHLSKNCIKTEGGLK